jgi:hypothetical protein
VDSRRRPCKLARPTHEHRAAYQVYHFALTTEPLRLHGAQPRAFGAQKAAYDPRPFYYLALFDLAVVFLDPRTDFFLACQVASSQKITTTPSRSSRRASPSTRRETGGYPGHRTAVHEAQPCLVELWHIGTVTGDSFGIGIVIGDRALNQTHKGLLASLKLCKKTGRATRLHQLSSSKPAVVRVSD